MPAPHRGLKHLALYCSQLEKTVHFYTALLGLTIVWQPDADNIYLSSGDDNLALHRAPAGFNASGQQRLDHLGFFLNTKQDVDDWHVFLKENKVEIKASPKDHRDGTRSFYCADPEGNVVQMIYYP
ncbi:MAG TPA: VOC family protein [Gammaproteobacteria bacterium]|jgi:catechol 2,3-dioxygenase-like lactoylglutathione lyase family enzyme|nr:VOC family protein [Gammaproteobacteria bacterium]